MADSRDDEVPDVKAETSEPSERQKDFTRRALLRAGWVVPAVTAINIPSASAQTPAPHNDVHGDAPHADEITVHADLHIDTPQPPHDDRSTTTMPRTQTHRIPTSALDDPHDDAPHTDTPPHAAILTFRIRTRRRTPTSRTQDDTGARRSPRARRRTHADSHGDAHEDHDDHTDGHADFTFKDHTDGGHADHLDTRITRITPTRAATRITLDNGHRDHTDGAFGHKDSQAYVDHNDSSHRDHTDSAFPSSGSPGRSLLGSPRRLPSGPSGRDLRSPRSHRQQLLGSPRQQPSGSHDANYQDSTGTNTHRDHTDVVHSDHADGSPHRRTLRRTPPHVDSHTDEHADGVRSPAATRTSTRIPTYSTRDVDHADFHGDSGRIGTAAHVDTHGDSPR